MPTPRPLSSICFGRSKLSKGLTTRKQPSTLARRWRRCARAAPINQLVKLTSKEPDLDIDDVIDAMVAKRWRSVAGDFERTLRGGEFLGVRATRLLRIFGERKSVVAVAIHRQPGAAAERECSAVLCS